MKILSYNEIDFAKYEYRLLSSAQYRYSARHIFLNTLCGKNWALIISDDNYSAMMPICFSKKLGLKIVVAPTYCQQLGVFSEKDDNALNQKFLDFLEKKFIIWYYPFNQNNNFPTLLQRKNYILKRNDYNEVYRKYSPKRKRKLRLDEEVAENSAIRKIEFSEAISFIKKNMLGTSNNKEQKNFLGKLSALDATDNMVFVAFYYHRKIINLLALYIDETSVALLGTYNDKNFIKKNGSSKLVDFAISKYIATHDFDFEGSNLPAVEEFFRGFRPSLHKYPYIVRSKKEIIKQCLLKVFPFLN